MMKYAIVVIDIGMTNKKVAVYDDSLRQLDAKYRNFEPNIIEGLPTHDLDGMEAWFIKEIKTFAAEYPVRGIAVSTHGATFVCLGKDGRAALPCVYYTYEPGDDFYDRFYRRFGPPLELQEQTGTPAFRALINPAKGIFFAQERFPEAFKNVGALLPFPQYWGFRFTGKLGAESTYMGCHTYLWNPVAGAPSSVARDLGVAELLPPNLNNSWDVLGTLTEDFAEKTGLSPDTIVSLGIHDSNSSLLPHFAKKGETGFVLNSTGTWCVIMNPVKKYGFAPEELGKVVFFNVSAFGKPIKTAIFLGGQEFESWSALIAARHGESGVPGWNEELYRTILAEKRLFLLPEITAGSGQFPGSRARIVEDGRAYFFDDMQRALAVPGESGGEAAFPPCFTDRGILFAILRISLVMQTLTALERTGISGRQIYTEGGFRRDQAYNRLLSSALTDNGVFLTGIAEATALGAAITAKMAIGGQSLTDMAGDFEVEYRPVEKDHIPELGTYRNAWLAEAEK
ncbi:MAG: carbohydrate kinase [Spirochaetaceae bacterium]|jgi:sugar (pentulose or hexulose) kinase|nr:carbohydrate kinase [Spirochaetaceae bacterium]